MLQLTSVKHRTLFNTCRRFFCSHEAQALELSFRNPCLSLQQYLEVPIFKNHEVSFNPTNEDIEIARELFLSKVGHEIKFIKSAYNLSQLPEHELPEVAFLGRSNVGKSSLLKSLLIDVPGLNVKTSKKPGHTKLLNFFEIGKKLCLVDLPGYGFKQPKSFSRTVEAFLKSRENLLKTFWLINGKDGFQPMDEFALDMLEKLKIPYALIMTKIDKASDSARLKNLLHLQNIRDKYTSVSCYPQPFMVSNVTFEGIAYFQAYIAHITGNSGKTSCMTQLHMP